MNELVRMDDMPEPVEPDTDSWIQVVGEVVQLASKIANTPFVPKGLRGSVPATAAAMLYGREVGLPPMTALTSTDVIEGKPSINAEAMRAMVYAAGHDLEFVETTGAVCTLRGRRRGQEHWTTVTWTIDMARAANLLGKSNWKAWPRDMLIARATTAICRMVFPDVIHGFRSIEEMEDAGGGRAELNSESRTKVQRKRGTSKKTGAGAAVSPPAGVPSPPAGAPRAAAPAPPLPGEPGYETGMSEAAASGEDAPGRAEAGASPASESSPDSDVPASPDADVVDAEIVEDVEVVEVPEHARPMSKYAAKAYHAKFRALGVTDRDERLYVTGILLGAPVASSSELNGDDATKVLNALERVETREQLEELVSALADAASRPPLDA